MHENIINYYTFYAIADDLLVHTDVKAMIPISIQPIIV